MCCIVGGRVASPVLSHLRPGRVWWHGCAHQRIAPTAPSGCRVTNASCDAGAAVPSPSRSRDLRHCVQRSQSTPHHAFLAAQAPQRETSIFGDAAVPPLMSLEPCLLAVRHQCVVGCCAHKFAGVPRAPRREQASARFRWLCVSRAVYSATVGALVAGLVEAQAPRRDTALSRSLGTCCLSTGIKAGSRANILAVLHAAPRCVGLAEMRSEAFSTGCPDSWAPLARRYGEGSAPSRLCGAGVTLAVHLVACQSERPMRQMAHPSTPRPRPPCEKYVQAACSRTQHILPPPPSAWTQVQTVGDNGRYEP